MTGIWSEAAQWLSDSSALKALAPTGRLRVGVAVGKARSAVWTCRDAAGRPQGVTVDIARRMAEMAELPLDLVEHDSSGAIIAAAASGTWDVAFAPVDDERRAVVDFGAAHYLGESVHLLPEGSAIRALADVNRAGVRIVGVENTATLRSARRTAPLATASGAATLDEALSLFRSGEADTLALGRESLMSLLPALPGARLLDEPFHFAATAVAAPKGRGAAIEIASALIEDMKADGVLRSSFDRWGMAEAAVAPAGARG
ncbi:hypothetical protein GCM10008171_15120 [Methylopila jiangsuensis]|uniref:Solute-binding protein family 3/N-terminal domain-containing protein n=1 Tax=Methylopila jiangsuensis TaxID=586230 RepID=A0A9W6N3G2_9HYPH|nr:transporter substrate-binding domain-containing protein [Methylopila jiangsuensis]MDR6284225.1 polar amino acid transport system substrate-binding protein [Methylopila jiangsuensis]GLK76258.1 hypothetical protein GCM10008171_15120 [Methylopila jiangsuensis]